MQLLFSFIFFRATVYNEKRIYDWKWFAMSVQQILSIGMDILRTVRIIKLKTESLPNSKIMHQ